MFKVYEFHWQAVSRFGQKQKGKQLAKSREQLEQKLFAKGYAKIKINRNFIFPQNPKTEEITQFISQLAMLLSAKIPLKQALVMVLDNCTNIKLYLWIGELISLVENGYSFSISLEKLDRFIQVQEIQLIKMGESTGRLALILTNISQARSKSEKLVKKVKKIMFYPIMILGISIALSLGLLIFIVPQFAELYGGKGKTLPFITKILFILSNFLQDNLNILIFIFILAVIFGLFLTKKTNLMPKIKMQLMSKLPVFKQIITQSRIVFFSQNIALMLNAHIRLDVALKSFLSEKSNDPILQNEVQFMLSLLKQGYKFSDSLNPTIFGSQIIQMITIGEQSGNLAKINEHIADIYQQKLDYQVDMLSQMLEPILMLVMGVIVGTIIIGLYLPIFDMGALVE